MGLYEQWIRLSRDQQGNPVNHVWDDYLAKEKIVYQGLIKNKENKIQGTVKEISEQFKLTPVQMCAFFDGINECVDNVPPLGDIEEDTKIDLVLDFKRLYKQMVEYKAENLYTMPEWETIFTKDEQKELYKEQKSSHTIVRADEKVGRNDPCTCGSGKKYKKCCGAAA